MEKTRRYHSYVAALAGVILAVLGLSFMVHMSWNLMAPAIAGAGELEFKNAFGLVGLALAGLLILRHAVGGRRHGIRGASAEGK
jgi:hypothetical protein